MSKLTKLVIAKYSIFVLTLIILLICYFLFKDTSNINYYLFTGIVIVGVAIIIIESRINKLKNAKLQEEKVKQQLEFEKFISVNREFNNIYDAMAIIVFKENSTINSLLEKLKIDIRFPFCDEENQYELYLMDKNKNGYYLSFGIEGLLTNSDNEYEDGIIPIDEVKSEEIIEYIIKDLKEYGDYN